MRLLSFEIVGQYKGLKDQRFNFEQSGNNIIALIGLNGAGKSQLLELIAECFSYLERHMRDDFKNRSWFEGVAVTISYANQAYDSELSSVFYEVNISTEGKLTWRNQEGLISLTDLDLEQLLPSHIIGYSSGLNENLQRAFMKNGIQYLDAMNAKRLWETRLGLIKRFWDDRNQNLTESDLEQYDRTLKEAYSYYQRRYPGIFPEITNDLRMTDNLELGIRATPLPMLKYLDHDSTVLLLISIGMLEDTDQAIVFNREERFNTIFSTKVKYDLRKFTYDVGAVLDVAKLISCVGGVDSDYFKPLSQRSSDEFYNQFELDYLVGEITIDFNNPSMRLLLRETYFQPVTLFEKLHRIQMLGAQFWPREMKSNLRQDNYLGNVKKPQKWRAPLQVLSLDLANTDQETVTFEDLSDGEAQLTQMLAMAAVFRETRTLFLLDEPETHLNPSWRTYFHSYLDSVLNVGEENTKVQLFISTHSPFMISSLKKQNVFCFKRKDDGFIEMSPAPSQTYGASFDVIIKEYFELRSLISHSVIDEIREQLKESDEHALEWIQENLGLSSERAYLIKKLSH